MYIPRALINHWMNDRNCVGIVRGGPVQALSKSIGSSPIGRRSIWRRIRPVHLLLSHRVALPVGLSLQVEAALTLL